jgi:L-alanine-DL-glutamate epimerase-like enolase superfamily enzyme
MATALRMEVNPATVIQAVKKMKKKERLIFLEDLIAATSPEYLRSIREARRDYKVGKVKSHREVFGR